MLNSILRARSNLIFLLPFLVSSCIPCRRVLKLKSSNYFKQQEARLIDIPIPMDIKSLEGSNGFSDKKNNLDSKFLLRFESLTSCQDMQNFYKEEMENLGWKLNYMFEDQQETFYNFCKPTRWCLVLIRASNKNCFISIFVGRDDFNSSR